MGIQIAVADNKWQLILATQMHSELRPSLVCLQLYQITEISPGRELTGEGDWEGLSPPATYIVSPYLSNFQPHKGPT